MTFETRPTLATVTRILVKLLTQRELACLTGRQRAAVREALMLTLVSRGLMPDEARSALRHELLALPWPSLVHEGTSGRIEPCLQLLHSDDADFLLPFAKSLSHELVDTSLKELVFRIMVALMFADGGTDGNLPVLAPLAAGLGLSCERAAQIVDEVEDDIATLVL